MSHAFAEYIRNKRFESADAGEVNLRARTQDGWIACRSGDDAVCKLGVKRMRQCFDRESSLNRGQHSDLDVERCFQPTEDLLPVARIQFNLVEGCNLFSWRAGNVADRMNDELTNEMGSHEFGHIVIDLHLAKG